MTDEIQKKLEQFKTLDPTEFNGGESEDAQGFLNRCHRIRYTAGIVDINRVSLTTFQLTGASYRWWKNYESCRLAGATPLTWHEFSVLLLEKFILQTR